MESTEFIYVGLNGYVVGLDRTSGEVVWQWKNTHGMASYGSPTLLPDGESLFVGITARVFCLNARTGTFVWDWKCPHWYTNASVVTLLREGDKLFAAVSGHVYCLDPATGDQVWANELKGFGTPDSPLATTICSQTLPPGVATPDARSTAIQSTIYQHVRKWPE
jgi:outer membrane protein assembly factor BamB